MNSEIYVTFAEKRLHSVVFRSDLHFTLTQILVNIFRSGYFSNKEAGVFFVGKIVRTKNIYENLRESEMKVRPKKHRVVHFLGRVHKMLLLTSLGRTMADIVRIQLIIAQVLVHSLQGHTRLHRSYF